MTPEPNITVPIPFAPLDLEHKEVRVQKADIITFLEAELTEERSDKVLEFLSDQAKLVLPDLPVEVAERVLDALVPKYLIKALDSVL
jgi:hypothetical protein